MHIDRPETSCDHCTHVSVMSRRRKHLTQQELVPPTIKQQIVRAKLSRGSNIFEASRNCHTIWSLKPSRPSLNHLYTFSLSVFLIVQAETADGRDLLCFLPAKFNKKLWIKRGGYIIVEEGDVDVQDKVTATIVKVLYEQDVKALKKLPGVWYVHVSPLKIIPLSVVSLLIFDLVLLI